ncbi:MAG TPA: flagellar hook protein FlgE [Burkholderiaceae bacterium]|nr:flagellar hook protein FlgE [Burkholderiaceae bacterium]
MSFQQGLSGLSAATRNLDVIGNNVANANTVGAKISRAEFSDVYANSLAFGGNVQTGIGVNVASIAQQFTQGQLTTTNNPLDVAVNGNGFFRMSADGVLEYTRNGQFRQDKDGYIVNSAGARLTGYPADSNGNITTGAPLELRLSTSDIAPRVTSEITSELNLDSRAANVTAAFDVTDSTTYTSATSVNVYDSLGNPHPLTLYFQKSAANTWDVYGAENGVQVTGGSLGTLTFGSDGKIASGGVVSFSLPVTTGAGTPIPINLDLGAATQFGASFGVTSLTQDGYGPGRLAGLSIAPDGTILGRYSNGQSRAQGQIALANFSDPQGLRPLGGNAWAESSTSGQPLLGAPGSGTFGVVQSGAVEESNVDLTSELVNMITAQRVYQANAQTIKTQDQVLQTLLNLK